MNSMAEYYKKTGNKRFIEVVSWDRGRSVIAVPAELYGDFLLDWLNENFRGIIEAWFEMEGMEECDE